MRYSCIQTRLDWIGSTGMDRFGLDIMDGWEETWKTSGCTYQTSARTNTLHACHLSHTKKCEFECSYIQNQFNKSEVKSQQWDLTRFVAVEVRQLGKVSVCG